MSIASTACKNGNIFENFEASVKLQGANLEHLEQGLPDAGLDEAPHEDPRIQRPPGSPILSILIFGFPISQGWQPPECQLPSSFSCWWGRVHIWTRIISVQQPDRQKCKPSAPFDTWRGFIHVWWGIAEHCLAIGSFLGFLTGTCNCELNNANQTVHSKIMQSLIIVLLLTILCPNRRLASKHCPLVSIGFRAVFRVKNEEVWEKRKKKGKRFASGERSKRWLA